MMARGTKPTSIRQSTMHGQWQDAESEARSRFDNLGYACDRVAPGDESLLLLMALIYRRTNDGLGPPWPISGWKTFIADPWGPRCKRSKIFQLIADARDAGILRVVAGEQFRNEAGTSYGIDWPGVYQIRGLPTPELLQPASSDRRNAARQYDGRSVEQSTPADRTPSAWTDTQSTPADTQSTPADTAGLPNGVCSQRVRAPVDDLIWFEDEENFIFNSNHSTSADSVVAAIYGHHRRNPSISRRSRVFLFSVVVIAERLGASWLEEAVEATAERKADSPPAFLYTCLENGLPDHFGLPRETLRQLLGKLRPAVQGHLHRHPWYPETALGPSANERLQRELAQIHAKAAAQPAQSGMKAEYLAAHRLSEGRRDGCWTNPGEKGDASE